MDFFDFSKLIYPANSDIAFTFSHRHTFDHPQNHSLHLNDHIELYIYISGDADFVVEDTYYSLSHRDILVINPQEVHVVVLKKPCVYERFYILIPRNAFDSARYSPIQRLVTKPKEASARIALSDAQKEQALALLYQISDLCKQGWNDSTNLLTYALIVQFLCILDQCALYDKNTLPTTTTDLPKLVRDILLYMGSDVAQIISVNDIAQRFHISAPYLSSLFKKYVGVTPSAYLRTKRIIQARRLLEEGCSVTDACYESGFTDSSYFIKVFKAVVGMTPLQYKSHYMKKQVSQ